MTPRAKRRDPNEAEIVAALRAVGASVQPLHTPVDLLVGFDDKNWLMEVKRPAGPKGGTSESGQRYNENQVKFVSGWRGQVDIVRTPAEACQLLEMWPGECEPWGQYQHVWLKQLCRAHCDHGLHWEVERDAAESLCRVVVKPKDAAWYFVALIDETTDYLEAGELIRRLVMKVQGQMLKEAGK